MIPPAPCTVTLPAHQRHAGTPPPAPLDMSASRQAVSRMPARSMRPRPCLRASCPGRFGAMREQEEPRSSFARPRPATSPLRACPPPRSYVPPGIAGQVARFARPPLSATAANAAPTARVASGCPSGQRRGYVTRPAARAFCERCVSALIHSRVWRSAHRRRGPTSLRSPAPRPAPASAFAWLSPPRETSRSFCPPFALGGLASQPPPCRSHHVAPPTSPAARLRRGMARGARARGEQGRSPARPRNSPASEGTSLRASLARWRGEPEPGLLCRQRQKLPAWCRINRHRGEADGGLRERECPLLNQREFPIHCLP